MKKYILLSLNILIVFATVLYAGPTIIRDDRITDVAMTPTLGRGYTIVTNTFQSKCLDEIVLTDPSYDFQYRFESIESNKSSDTSGEVSAHANGTVAPGLTVDLTTKTNYASGVKEFYHHIYVEINMDTYYASVDEARTRMGNTAAQLLRNNDIPGFFSSCGSYYVRSIGRNAKFVAVFTYSDKSETKDFAFEAALEMEIKGFGTAGGGVKSTVKQAAGEKRLTITAQAWGLGKNEGATLISYDIETFKAAIKDAFISMQNPMTGKIRTMEIVPWVENTEFQNLVQLEKEVKDKDGKPVLLYQKKQILNENAEFLAEIERADRNMMNIFYKGKICRQTIDANWVSDVQSGTLHKNFKDAEVVNNKFPNDKIKLDELNKLLSNAELEKILTAETDFMYKPGEGANECIKDLLGSGMFAKSYRDFPNTCVKIRDKFSMVIGKTVDDYCMPQLASPAKPEPAPPAPGPGK